MKKIMEIYPKGHDSLTVWLVCISEPHKRDSWFVGLVKAGGVPDLDNGTTTAFYDPALIKTLGHEVGLWLTNKFSVIDTDRVAMNRSVL